MNTPTHSIDDEVIKTDPPFLRSVLMCIIPLAFMGFAFVMLYPFIKDGLKPIHLFFPVILTPLTLAWVYDAFRTMHALRITFSKDAVRIDRLRLVRDGVSSTRIHSIPDVSHFSQLIKTHKNSSTYIIHIHTSEGIKRTLYKSSNQEETALMLNALCAALKARQNSDPAFSSLPSTFDGELISLARHEQDKTRIHIAPATPPRRALTALVWLILILAGFAPLLIFEIRQIPFNYFFALGLVITFLVVFAGIFADALYHLKTYTLTLDDTHVNIQVAYLGLRAHQLARCPLDEVEIKRGDRIELAVPGHLPIHLAARMQKREVDLLDAYLSPACHAPGMK